MPTLTLTFDTGAVPLTRVADALAAANGWTATIPDPANPGVQIANPQTKAAAAKEFVKTTIIRTVREQEYAAAQQAATTGVTPIALT